MSETAEIFQAMKEIGQQKRRTNLEQSTRILKQNNIKFSSNNGGVHLIVGDPATFDFWPSTGKYISRDKKIQGRGVFKLLKLLKGAEQV